MKKTLSLSGCVLGAILLLVNPVSAQDCETITLGSALSLTGKYATNGVHTKNGYDFAIQKISDAGGVKIAGKCYHFDVIYYDDESRSDRGAALAERLINQDKVQYMLGPYSSTLTHAIAPVTEKYQVPMVEAGGSSRSLFNQGYRYLFAVLSTSEQYFVSAMTLAASKAEQSGRQPSSVKVAIAVMDDVSPLDIRAGVLEEAARYGMNVVVDEQFSQDSPDMSAILSKVELQKPDLLIVSGYSKGAATAVQQISEQGISTPMIAITHCESADVVGNFGDAANDILCATQWAETLNYEDSLFGSAANYAEELKLAFPEYEGKAVPYQVAQSSAAVYVFKDAFERAGSLDKERVRDAIAQTDRMTFYGAIRFSEAGNNIAKPMALRQIQDGEYHLVAPSEFSSHEVRWPRMSR